MTQSCHFLSICLYYTIYRPMKADTLCESIIYSILKLFSEILLIIYYSFVKDH